MKSILDIINELTKKRKKLNIQKLPSQGFFYNDDMIIWIKKADDVDIKEYETHFDKDNLFSIIESIKDVVRKNTTFNKEYKFGDIKSIDIVYIFLEIVKITKGKSIKVSYFNDIKGEEEYIEFSDRNFNYFDFSKYASQYNKETHEILMNGYRFSMPSIGIENSLTQFLIAKSNEKDSEKYNRYNYDFLFFSSNKNKLTFKEIENLVEIFNFDIDQKEREKVKEVVEKFMGLVGYSLKSEDSLIEIKSKIDLINIWK